MSDLDELIGSRARDDNGRFKSVTPTEPVLEAVEPVVQTPAPVKAEVPPPVVESAPAPTPPAPTESAQEQAYKKAMREEREKRQAAEARLRALEKPQAQVDPWADLPGALQNQQAQFDERLFVERCNLTEEIARDKHKDYDEVRDSFLEAAQENPSLMAQMRAERNPAAFAYREGKRIKALKEVNGDFGAYEAKLEAKIRAEYEAKYANKPAVPASLNSDGSPAPVEVYAGPKPLREILRNKL